MKIEISNGDRAIDTGIENDEELLKELSELGGASPPETPTKNLVPRPSTVPVSEDPPSKGTPSPQDIVDVLEKRLKNYVEAEAAAKTLGDITKARR